MSKTVIQHNQYRVIVLDETALANETNAGLFRYYVSGGFSKLECCMQTEATNYQWVTISEQEIL